MTEQELDQMLDQSRNTQRIVTNFHRSVKEASYPGTVCYQIAEGLAFLEDISRQLKAGIDKLEADKKAAKKAGKAEDAGLKVVEKSADLEAPASPESANVG